MAVAILAGATGLIGSQLFELLLKDPAYTRVIALSRKPLLTQHAKLQNLIVDFDSLENYADQLKGDVVFCCLGTTLQQAGSREAFRKVDFDYPLSLARMAYAQGAKQYLLVTALGSDKRSTIFYNRIKGEVEEAIGQVGYECLSIFQPSMLLGQRSEKRTGESAGKMIMTSLGFLIPKKYKAIESIKVARAMVHIAAMAKTGSHKYVSEELQDY